MDLCHFFNLLQPSVVMRFDSTASLLEAFDIGKMYYESTHVFVDAWLYAQKAKSQSSLEKSALSTFPCNQQQQRWMTSFQCGIILHMGQQ